MSVLLNAAIFQAGWFASILCAANGMPWIAVWAGLAVVAALDQPLQGIVLPAQAVTRSPANEPVVWIKASAERYVPQPVRVQAVDAHTVLVTHGLGPDNRVVVQGASLIAQIR